MATAVKICGITRVEDALAAAHAGAHAIGLIFASESPRRVSLAVARTIIEALPAFVTPVALFVDQPPAEIERVLDEVGPLLLQFHGDETPDFCVRFGMPYIKVVRVGPEVDLLQYAGRHRAAKGLLLDAFVEGSRGGPGSPFTWRLIPAKLPLPLILAGGLDPDNVGDAVRRVRPWAVDVSSGGATAQGLKSAANI